MWSAGQRTPRNLSNLTMTITVPTTTQLGARFEGIARFVAAILVAVYVAGAWTRDTIEGLASWTQRLIEAPLQTLIDLVPTVEEQPEVLAILGAQLLEPAELELEIREFKAKAKPVARRKPAKARKTAVAA
jgi:hypothetical protein